MKVHGHNPSTFPAELMELRKDANARLIKHLESNQQALDIIVLLSQDQHTVASRVAQDVFNRLSEEDEDAIFAYLDACTAFQKRKHH